MADSPGLVHDDSLSQPLPTWAVVTLVVFGTLKAYLFGTAVVGGDVDGMYAFMARTFSWLISTLPVLLIFLTELELAIRRRSIRGTDISALCPRFQEQHVFNLHAASLALIGALGRALPWSTRLWVANCILASLVVWNLSIWGWLIRKRASVASTAK